MRVEALSPDRAPAARGVPGTEIGPFGEVGLRKDDGTCCPQPLYDDGISQWLAHCECERTGCGSFASCCVYVVLDEHGNAVEWPTHIPPGPLCVQGLRRLYRVGADSDHRAQRGFGPSTSAMRKRSVSTSSTEVVEPASRRRRDSEAEWKPTPAVEGLGSAAEKSGSVTTQVWPTWCSGAGLSRAHTAELAGMSSRRACSLATGACCDRGMTKKVPTAASSATAPARRIPNAIALV